MSSGFKAFVSEEEVQEERQRRQAEWERVRRPEDPEECPEEETRSLFDQLKANRDAADREKEDEDRQRSMVKGLDNEEIQFLNFVSNRQIQIEKERNREEKSVIEEMKNASVIKVQEKDGESQDQIKSSLSSAATSTTKISQKLILQGAIKRKSCEDPDTSRSKSQRICSYEDEPEKCSDAKLMAGIPSANGGTMVVAGILPGISDYADDDSSTENESNTSDSEADHMIAPSVVTRRVVQEMMNKLKGGDDDGD